MIHSAPMCMDLETALRAHKGDHLAVVYCESAKSSDIYLYSHWVASSLLYYPPGVLHKLFQAQGLDQAFLDQALGGEHGGRAVWASAQSRIQKHELLNLP